MDVCINLLDISEDGYLGLVEWTGLQVAGGKPGVLDKESREIVGRMGLDAEAWVETVRGFGRMFSSVAGSKDKFREQARLPPDMGHELSPCDVCRVAKWDASGNRGNHPNRHCRRAKRAQVSRNAPSEEDSAANFAI